MGKIHEGWEKFMKDGKKIANKYIYI